MVAAKFDPDAPESEDSIGSASDAPDSGSDSSGTA